MSIFYGIGWNYLTNTWWVWGTIEHDFYEWFNPGWRNMRDMKTKTVIDGKKKEKINLNKLRNVEFNFGGGKWDVDVIWCVKLNHVDEWWLTMKV